MNWFWNMMMDLIIMAFVIGLILIVSEWDTLAKVIGLGCVLMFYGFTHALLTMKRMGYRC